VGRALLFALLAALNPTLLTATTVMLLLPNPRRLMFGYLGGAFTTGMVVGISVVEWLPNSSAVGTTKHTVAPSVDLAFGAIALLAAYVLHGDRHRRNKSDEPKKTPRWQQKLSGGSARTTFVVGLLLSFPGASYLAALSEINKQNYGATGVVLAVLLANIVMLLLLEVPIVGFFVAPDWTRDAVERLKAWLAANGRHAITVALVVVAALFFLRALITVVG
jgi:Sap-like sulfolipid-1-addressing protein